jgi:hypothetical protein
VHGVLGWAWPPALLALVVWMTIRARRQLRSRTRSWIVYPVLASLTLASVGAGYETVRKALDATAYPMPGQLVDVGGLDVGAGPREEGTDPALRRGRL